MNLKEARDEFLERYLPNASIVQVGSPPRGWAVDVSIGPWDDAHEQITLAVFDRKRDAERYAAKLNKALALPDSGWEPMR